MSAVELGIATSDKEFVSTILKEFPEVDVRLESGFGVLAVVGTILVPTATLAIRVAEFIYSHRRQKPDGEELLYVQYKKGPGYVEINAKGLDEKEVLARLRAIGGDIES